LVFPLRKDTRAKRRKIARETREKKRGKEYLINLGRWQRRRGVAGNAGGAASNYSPAVSLPERLT